jgi:CRP/FNR family cyclic AMP-dependent transcriptional regulator
MPVRAAEAVGRHAGGLLDSLNVAHTSVRFEPFETIFAQGDHSSSVLYIERGRVRLSVCPPGGRTSMVAMLRAGAFFGEGALAGQRRRRSTAESVTSCSIAIVKTTEMRRRLLEEPALSDRFRSHLLARNVRIEQDVVDQIFNGCDKRLARVLLLLVHFEEHPSERYPLPRISRDLLAEMSGITASKVGALMHRFRRLGFLERNSDRRGGVQVHRSMLNVVLQGDAANREGPRS